MAERERGRQREARKERGREKEKDRQRGRECQNIRKQLAKSSNPQTWTRSYLGNTRAKHRDIVHMILRAR